MNYLSVCSGIEAASVAWESLGWKAIGFSEIETFPCSVLAHRFPNVKNYGDMTRFKEWDINETVDLLVGGTPCQSFSIAGLRGGLDDGRGNLALTYCQILQRFKPRWFVWENVPGVFSSWSGDSPDSLGVEAGPGREMDLDETSDFASILAGFSELGYGYAWSVRDAQYFGVPQRRRRVFVVGYLGDWRRAAEVLFESGCLSGNTAKSRKPKQDVAGTLASRTTAGGGLGTDFDLTGRLQVASPITSRPYGDRGVGEDRLISCTLPASDGGVSSGYHPVVAFDVRNGTGSPVSQTLQSHHGGSSLNTMPVIATSTGNRSHCLNAGGMGRQDYETETMVVTGALSADDGEQGFTTLQAANSGMLQVCGPQRSAVRRLTPMECERLQGFPDDWTFVPHRGKPAADGPRYKSIGNSMAVPVMRWIGERIKSVEERIRTESIHCENGG